VSDLRQRLLAAFQVESAEHLHGMRAILAASGAGGTPPGIDEAFRRAHSLKGAARAVEMQAVESFAHLIETLFTRVRTQDLELAEQTRALLLEALDEIEDLVAAYLGGLGPPGPSGVRQAIEQLVGGAAQSSTGEARAAVAGPMGAGSGALATAAGPVHADTVRVGVQDLERVTRSATLLALEASRQEGVGGEIRAFVRAARRLDRRCQSLRAEPGLRRLLSERAAAALSVELETLQQEAHVLSGRARSLQRLHWRAAWGQRSATEALQQDLRQARMVPAGSVFDGFRSMVRQLARDQGKEIELHTVGFDVEADRMVLQALKDPVMHLLRNAVDHGIEAPETRERAGKPRCGNIGLQVEAEGSRLCVRVQDDGRGFELGQIRRTAAARGLTGSAEAAGDAEIVQLLFLPGFSTATEVTEVSGRGMGLSVVQQEVHRLQGDVSVAGTPGHGCAFTITAPLAVAAHRMLMVGCQGQRFLVPAGSVARLQRVRKSELRTVEGSTAMLVGGDTVPVLALAELLGLGDRTVAEHGGWVQVVQLQAAGRRAGLAVDALLAVSDHVVVDLGLPPAQCRDFAGGVILDDGAVCLVLRPSELLCARTGRGPVATAAPAAAPRRPAILVVDDSITTRTLEKSILEAHGYRVVVAVDGQEALTVLRGGGIGAVVSDVQMPRLDGFGLLAAIKADPELRRTPVVLVTSLERPEDRQRGLELGADAYVVKSRFDQCDLLATITQIL